MEEKSKIGFIPGLALILGALAIALFIINSIKKNPAAELMEQELRGKMLAIAGEVNALNQQMAGLDPETLEADIRAKVGKDLRVVSNSVEEVNLSLVKRDVQDIETALENIRENGDPALQNDVLVIERALRSLKEKVRDSERSTLVSPEK